jgi:hypothetical protein
VGTSEELLETCGRRWQEVENILRDASETITSIQVLRPPFSADPLGELRVILLKRTSSGLVVLVSHENYRSANRQPRSEEPLAKLDADG